MPLSNLANLANPYSAFLSATLFSATPLVLAAMGGILSERAGVVNIALEGLILTGAFVGVVAEHAAQGMGGAAPFVGLLCAVLAGGLLGLLHAFLTQRTRMNHVVSGLGINLLAAGATRYLALRLFPEGMRVAGLPGSLFLTLAFVLPFPGVWTAGAYHVRFALAGGGREPGKRPHGGDRPRTTALYRRHAVRDAGGAGGRVPVAGRIAQLRKQYVGRAGLYRACRRDLRQWTPGGAALGALFFGFCYALQTQLQLLGKHVVFLGVEWTSPYLLDALPYLMTLLALVSVIGRATPPAALGQEDA